MGLRRVHDVVSIGGNMLKTLRFYGNVIKYSLIFWALETVIFLIIHGWHREAIGVEKYFDNLFLVVFIFGFTSWLYSIHKLAIEILETIERK